jgi:hypothetical protein
MTAQLSRPNVGATQLVPRSALVRRLLQAGNDPAKQRLRSWLVAIDDGRLHEFGLTREDIVILRAFTRAE